MRLRRSGVRSMAISTLFGESGNASGPFAFDCGSPFKFESEFAEEIDDRVQVVDEDSDIVNSIERHVSNLQGAV